MTLDDLDGLRARMPGEDDHPRVLRVLDEWWEGLKGPSGSLERQLLLPRLFFQHFTPGSRIVESSDGSILAFLVGFLSQSDPASAYIHFVGVHPAWRRCGLGSSLYREFFSYAAGNGRRRIHAITSPENSRSVAYHTRLGFAVNPGGALIAGTPVHPDYDGPGRPRVVFTLDLLSDPEPATTTTGGSA
jgi:ribosomal protein S18 acetylase RimI-like enzyme